MAKKKKNKKVVEVKAVQSGVKNTLKGFGAFISKHSIVSLAVGLIIGQAVKDVVNSLVTGIISPFLSIIFSKVIKTENLSDLKFEILEQEFMVGSFIDMLIQMIVILFIIYIAFGVLFKKSGIVETEEKK